jgi:outer membrane protein assembly factor BamB
MESVFTTRNMQSLQGCCSFGCIFVCILQVATVGLLLGDESLAPQWNEFRGANGSGVAKECNPPVEIDPNKPAWKTSVPSGISSPIIAGELLILTGLEEGRLQTLALKRSDGSVAWKQVLPDVPLEQTHEMNSPAACSAVADQENVYVYFGSYGLIAYRIDGEKRWERRLATPRSLYGVTTSPIVHDGRLFLVVDDDNNLPGSAASASRVMAIRCSDGEIVWETPRPFFRSGWSTPTIWKHGNSVDLIVLGSGRLCCYDAGSGEEKWYVNGFSRETISRPIVDEQHVYASASMIGGVADEQPDREPYWQALMQFDANGDQRLQRNEMTEKFSFPFRPELPIGHPGFGVPLPRDPAKRTERLDSMFSGVDRNRDGGWDKDEFLRVISFDRGKPNLLAVRDGGLGDVTESHVVWALHQGIPEIPSPVLWEEIIYMVGNGGLMTAVNRQTGKVVFRKRVSAGGQYRASPVIAAGFLYVLSDEGVLTILEATEKFNVVLQVQLPEAIAATPAIDRDTIYIRGEKSVIAYRRR